MYLLSFVAAVALSAFALTGDPGVSRATATGVAYDSGPSNAGEPAAVVKDWSQWRGPDRSGLAKETGLLKQWPKSGPPQAWSISGLGSGYGTVSLLADKIYVQGTQGNSSVVLCLNRADGRKIWTKPLGRSLNDSRGGGPRGTPTVEADCLYALTEAGDLACLRTRDGSLVWSRNILKDFGGSNPNWKCSESPLIDGNNVIVTPGGNRASVVALDKTTGKTVWASRELSDRAAYSSCVIAEAGGVRAVTTLTASAAVGVRASDGKLLWRYPRVANRTANVATPVVQGRRVLYTTAYSTGCALLELAAQNGGIEAREVYFSRDMMNHHGGIVLVDGFVYGFSGSILTCMEFATGKVRWKDRSVGKGSLTYADGDLYLLGENNTVGLAQASPDGYREGGRFRIADQGWPSWAHPVVCAGKLYIRNQGVLTCYDVAEKR